MHRFTLALITLVAIILTVAPVAAQGTVNISPNADTYISQLYSDRNYGDRDMLNAGSLGIGNHYRGLLNFNTSDVLPDGQYATAVNLHLTPDGWYTHGDNAIIGIFQIDGSWSESAATWDNTHTFLGSQIGTDTITVTGSMPATVTFNIPISAWQEITNFDIYLAMTNEGSGATGFWQPYSREGTSGLNQPYLEIAHSPEPCSMALASLALGMIGFAARRRRKDE